MAEAPVPTTATRLPVRSWSWLHQALWLRWRQARLVAAILADRTSAAEPPLPSSLLDAAAHLLNGAYESLARWWADHPDLSAAQLAELATDALFPGLLAIAAAPPAGWAP